MSDSRRNQWYRQRKKRGFDDRETWSLDHTIAKFVLPRLIRFKEVTVGYPGNLTMEKWQSILDQMIYAMQGTIDEWKGEDTFNSRKELLNHYKKMNKGTDLFGKYFLHLWW